MDTNNGFAVKVEECQHLVEFHAGFENDSPVYVCLDCGDVWVDTGITDGEEF